MEHSTPAQMILSFILLLLLGGITAYFAEKRGRGIGVWFFIGMLLGIFGLILLFLLPSYAPGEKNDLKVEPVQVIPEGTITPPPLPTPTSEKLWFYVDQNRQQQGPVPFSQIQALLDKQELTPASLVWSEGMESWKKFSEIQKP